MKMYQLDTNIGSFIYIYCTTIEQLNDLLNKNCGIEL